MQRTNTSIRVVAPDLVEEAEVTKDFTHQEPAEGMEAVEHEENPRNSTVYRTLAYSGAVVSVLICMIALILAAAANGDWTKCEPSSAYNRKYSSGKRSCSWADSYNISGVLVSIMLVPLLIVLPPVFKRKALRAATGLILIVVAVLLLVVQVVSGVVWAVLTSADESKGADQLLLRKLPGLILQGCLAAALATCLLLLARITRQREVSANQATESRQVWIHGLHLSIVLGSTLLMGGGMSLGGGEGFGKADYGMFAGLTFCLILVVQLRHYAIAHTGFYTRNRAAIRTRHFIEDFQLTPLEKDMVRKEGQTARYIQAVFTKEVFSGGLAPC